MALSSKKRKNIFIIPLNSIEQVIQKKNIFILIFGLEWMGSKFAEKHNKDKVAIEMYQGKKLDLQESKKGILQRVEKFMQYIKTYATQSSLC